MCENDARAQPRRRKQTLTPFSNCFLLQTMRQRARRAGMCLRRGSLAAGSTVDRRIVGESTSITQNDPRFHFDVGRWRGHGAMGVPRVCGNVVPRARRAVQPLYKPAVTAELYRHFIAILLFWRPTRIRHTHIVGCNMFDGARPAVHRFPAINNSSYLGGGNQLFHCCRWAPTVA